MTVTRISEWACLKPGRDNFTVRPETDADLYFGRTKLEQNLRAQLLYGLSVTGVPRMVIFGPYGSGKTHTLHHIKWFLENAELPEASQVRVVKMPLLGRGSTFLALHSKLVDAVGLEYIRTVLNQFMATRSASWIDDLTAIAGDANVAQGLRGMLLGGTMQLTSWRWLMGEKIGDADQANLQITRSYTGAEDLVQILQSLAALIRSVSNERLVFLIDEAELLDGIKAPEAVDSFREAIRLLSEEASSNVGFVIAALRPFEDESPSFLILKGGSVSTRLGEKNYVEIPQMEPVVAAEFVKELLGALVDNECVQTRSVEEPELFPFSTSAIELLDQWITEDPTRQLPRPIIQALNNGAFSAWEAGKEYVDGAAMARALGL